MLKGPEYWKAFNEGVAHGEKDTLRRTILRLESLKKVKGIGDKTFEKVKNLINGVEK